MEKRIIKPLNNESIMKMSVFITAHLRRYIRSNGYPNIQDGNVEDLILYVDNAAGHKKENYQRVIYDYIKKLSADAVRATKQPIYITGDETEYDTVKEVVKRPSAYEGIKITQYFEEFYTNSVDYDDWECILMPALDSIIWHECLKLVEDTPFYRNANVGLTEYPDICNG